MKEILNLVQTTLDTLFTQDGIRCFWGKRAEIDADPAATEYIIYTYTNDNAEVSADGKLYYRTASIALQYYIKYAVARTYEGRQTAADRMDDILEAMRTAGFGCSGGWSEIGDIDDVGFATFRSTYDIPHLMDGE